MLFGMIAAAVAGVATVIQAGLNKGLSDRWGLGWALVVNSVIVLAFSLVFWGVTRGSSIQDVSWKWHAVIPGLCGFLIVAGIPFAIPRLGALGVFLVIVAFQLVASLFWDRWMENIPLSMPRILGILLAFIGVWLASRR